ELDASNHAIFVGVQRGHESISEEHAGPKTAGPSGSAAAAEAKALERLPLRCSSDLIGHGLRAGSHESFDRFDRLEETAGPAKAPAFSAIVSTGARTRCAVPAGTASTETTAKTGRLNGFTFDHVVEATQFFIRLHLDGR